VQWKCWCCWSSFASLTHPLFAPDPAAAVWAAYFEENTLPACGDGKNFTYKHWDETLPDSVAVAPGPNNTEPGTGINGHEDGTYLWDEVRACGHKPFVFNVPGSCQRLPLATHKFITGFHPDLCQARSPQLPR
jgi:hypothetical protein